MRYRILLFFPALIITAFSSFAQSDDQPVKKKGELYLTWGYHRDTYTNSTIHFVDKNANVNVAPDNTKFPYDFTFHHAKAKDQPDFHDLFNTALSVPQYVFNLGYFFNDKHDLGIEVSWDHLKYVVVDNQRMHVTGTFGGKHYDVDTLVTPSFVHYEHTNGNNYLMVSLVKRMKLFQFTPAKQSLNAIFKVGGGLLDPKTDSNMFLHHNDGPFRISGIVFGASANMRYNFFKYFYLEAGVKAAVADYTSVKLYDSGRATQVFGSLQFIGAAGLTVPL